MMNDECGMMKSEEGEEGLGIEAGIGRSGGVTPYMIVVFSVSGSVSGSVSKLLGNAPRNFGFRFSIEPLRAVGSPSRKPIPIPTPTPMARIRVYTKCAEQLLGIRGLGVWGIEHGAWGPGETPVYDREPFGLPVKSADARTAVHFTG